MEAYALDSEESGSRLSMGELGPASADPPWSRQVEGETDPLHNFGRRGHNPLPDKPLVLPHRFARPQSGRHDDDQTCGEWIGFVFRGDCHALRIGECLAGEPNGDFGVMAQTACVAERAHRREVE